MGTGKTYFVDQIITNSTGFASATVCLVICGMASKAVGGLAGVTGVVLKVVHLSAVKTFCGVGCVDTIGRGYLAVTGS